MFDSKIQTLTEVSPRTQDDELPDVRSVLDQPGGLSFIVGVGQNASYSNHEGSQIELTENQIVLTPGSRFSYFELDLRFDAQSQLPTTVSLDQNPLMWVEETEWDECTSCILSKVDGQLWIRLPPHQNQPQSIEWSF